MHTAAAEWTKTVFPGVSHSWEDIAFLKKHWDGPIILKGIQTVEDAQQAVEMGVSRTAYRWMNNLLTTRTCRSKASW